MKLFTFLCLFSQLIYAQEVVPSLEDHKQFSIQAVVRIQEWDKDSMKDIVCERPKASFGYSVDEVIEEPFEIEFEAPMVFYVKGTDMMPIHPSTFFVIDEKYVIYDVKQFAFLVYSKTGKFLKAIEVPNFFDLQAADRFGFDQSRKNLMIYSNRSYWQVPLSVVRKSIETGKKIEMKDIKQLADDYYDYEIKNPYTNLYQESENRYEINGKKVDFADPDADEEPGSKLTYTFPPGSIFVDGDTVYQMATTESENWTDNHQVTYHFYKVKI